MSAAGQKDVIRIGLYGTNGHQLSPHLAGRARVVAAADYPSEGLNPSIRVYQRTV